jgi:hypothetical protein
MTSDAPRERAETVLARPELARCSLVKAIDLAWPQEFAYWLVYPDANSGQPKISAIRQWVLSQSQPAARRQPMQGGTGSGSRESRIRRGSEGFRSPPPQG